MAFKMKGFSPFTKDGETAEEKLEKLRKKEENKLKLLWTLFNNLILKKCNFQQTR